MKLRLKKLASVAMALSLLSGTAMAADDELTIYNIASMSGAFAN